MRVRPPACVAVVAVVLAACGNGGQVPDAPGEATATIEAAVTPLEPREGCTDTFVAHELDHVIDIDTEQPGFEGNGSGLAVGDLDGDRDLDLVLGSLTGETVVATNAGGWRFDLTPVAEGPVRGVVIADLDGDALTDLLLSPGTGPPRWLRGTDGGYEEAPLPGVGDEPAYVTEVGDPDGDGDLDLVTASYDVLLWNLDGREIVEGDGHGVWYWSNDAQQYVGTQLAESSQALALLLTDVERDGRPDLLVGNDFIPTDQRWTWTGGEFEATEELPAMSTSTMSLDDGDVDNDGQPELFATDMRNMDDANAEFWSLMEQIMTSFPAEDLGPQLWQNTLVDGVSLDERAEDVGIARTGWSWSGKFGDLDLDGNVDLYVVNGMAASENLPIYPLTELVEPNVAFRNTGGSFDPAPEWGLDARAGGRAMSLADLDLDGDLDVAVTNVAAPSVVFENQLCTDGRALEIDLRQPEVANHDAIGAEVAVVTGDTTRTRRVRAQSGYLSGDTSRLHVAIPPDETLERIDVRWPDGAVSTAPADTVAVDALITLTRSG